MDNYLISSTFLFLTILFSIPFLITDNIAASKLIVENKYYKNDEILETQFGEYIQAPNAFFQHLAFLIHVWVWPSNKPPLQHFKHEYIQQLFKMH